MKFKKILSNINLVNKISGEGKLKIYDEVERTLTRYFFPSKTIEDFLNEKYCIKRQIIQIVMIILLWIAPIKWLIELIVYQTHDYHWAAYYTSYFGRAFGKDEVSFTSLGILIIFSGNYYHSFCKLVAIDIY